MSAYIKTVRTAKWNKVEGLVVKAHISCKTESLASSEHSY